MLFNPTAEHYSLLKTHHRVRSLVYIMDNQYRVLSDASGNLISGVVDMDATGSVSRSGSVNLLDPANSLGLDYGSNALYNRWIKIVYQVAPLVGDTWHSTDLFTGPITKSTKDGVVASVEFSGVELLAQSGMIMSYTWPTGWPRSMVIMNAMTIFTGQQHFVDHSGGNAYLGQPWTVESGDNLWERLKELADSMGMKLYFDGRGFCCISPKNTAACFVFDSTWLTSRPTQAFDTDNLKNMVKIEGASVAISPDPDVDKVKLTYEAWPPPQHPFSPQSLGRYGVGRILPHFISDDSLSNWPDITATAHNNLNWDLLLTADVSATSAIVPFLEEYDVININHPQLFGDFALTKYSIPLVGDAEMSLNFFSSTSRGSLAGSRGVSNAGNWGRLTQPGVKHGPSGAYNTLGGKGGKKGSKWYTGDKGPKTSPNKGKKKKNKKKKGKGKK